MMYWSEMLTDCDGEQNYWVYKELDSDWLGRIDCFQLTDREKAFHVRSYYLNSLERDMGYESTLDAAKLRLENYFQMLNNFAS